VVSGGYKEGLSENPLKGKGLSDGSKRLSLPSYKAERPVVLSQTTLEPCTGASKPEQQDLHTRTTRSDRGHKGLVRL
jgi:hypothetical protein